MAMDEICNRNNCMEVVAKEPCMLCEAMYQQGKLDAINECLAIINKIMPPQPYLLKSKHYENWKMKTTELRMLRDMIEQLKEHNK